MGEPVTSVFLRGVPRRLVREAKAAAARRGATLAAFVSDALAGALEPGAASGPAANDLLADDTAWYARHRPRLLRRYAGQYVAVREGRVLDHDADFEALAERVFARLGTGPVFMPRVEAGERRVRVPSPRRQRP